MQLKERVEREGEWAKERMKQRRWERRRQGFCEKHTVELFFQNTLFYLHITNLIMNLKRINVN